MSVNTDTIRVVAAIADKKQVLLYLEDGSTLPISQDDHRLDKLMNAIIPITTKGEVAVISLGDFSVYAAFEQKTGGVTKFFKMAKSKVLGFFGSAKEPELEAVKLPDEVGQELVKAVDNLNRERTDPQQPTAGVGGPATPDAEPLPNTVESVQKHGTQVGPNDEVGPDEVVVAVIGDKVIPGVDKLKNHISHAVRSNSPEAVQAFLVRCAAFIDKRQHSVDDLMRFLERGDLPLTVDGSIIAYKLLNTRKGDKGDYVDVHSGNVHQKVGDYVCVNEDLVDLNRRNECSNGLHIARRGYLGGFSGNVCVLCKIDPEDVMVVPHNDANKVRVKGYHILAELSPAAFQLLKANKPMTGEEDALRVVYEAIKGNHIARLREVKVNGQRGTNLSFTPLVRGKKVVNSDASGNELNKAAALDDTKNGVSTLSPKEINKRLAEAEAEAQQVSNPPTDEGKAVIEQALAEAPELEPKKEEAPVTPAPNTSTGSALDDLLLDWKTAPDGQPKVDAAKALVAFKKAKKKSWEKIGIPDHTSRHIIMDAETEVTTKTEVKPATESRPATKVTTKTTKTPVKAASAPAKAGKASVKPTPASKTKAPTAPKPAPAPSGKKSKAEQARELFTAGKIEDLKAFKKAAKKGWSVLGFTDAEIKKIEE